MPMHSAIVVGGIGIVQSAAKHTCPNLTGPIWYQEELQLSMFLLVGYMQNELTPATAIHPSSYRKCLSLDHRYQILAMITSTAQCLANDETFLRAHYVLRN
jgi:hypothetical protein